MHVKEHKHMQSLATASGYSFEVPLHVIRLHHWRIAHLQPKFDCLPWSHVLCKVQTEVIVVI